MIMLIIIIFKSGVLLLQVRRDFRVFNALFRVYKGRQKDFSLMSAAVPANMAHCSCNVQSLSTLLLTLVVNKSYSSCHLPYIHSGHVFDREIQLSI